MNRSIFRAPSLGASSLRTLITLGAVLATHASAHAQNATCTTDEDCPDHMACQAQTSWVCDGGGSAGTGAGGTGGTAGADTGGSGGSAGAAGMMEPPSCEEVPADSICIPRYQLPCESASDCGGGFDCVESSYWMCSGGGSAGAAGASTGGSGGAVMEDPGSGGTGMTDECEEVPSGESSCQLQDLPCSVTSDCPSGLQCLEQYVYPPCTGGSGGSGGFGETGGTSGTGAAGVGGAAGTAGSGGAVMGGSGGEEYSCPDPVIQLRCMPEQTGMGGSGGTSGGGSGGGEAGMGGTDPGATGGSGGSGSGGSAGAGGAAGTGSGSAGTSPGDDDGEADEDSGHHHGGRGHRGFLARLLRGCSAGGAPSETDPVSAAMFGMLALALSWRARRFSARRG